MNPVKPATDHAVRRGVMAAYFTLAIAGPLLSGCSEEQGRAAPVDPSLARDALNTALESWKKGEAIDALKSGSPPIVAQDFDWMAGSKLVEYQLLGDGTPEDANLRARVQLTVRDPQGRTSTKAVTYVVGTDPKLTVFRAME